MKVWIVEDNCDVAVFDSFEGAVKFATEELILDTKLWTRQEIIDTFVREEEVRS